MSTDKTLADVQPGGRVRLGDQAELDRHEFQAWTRELLPCPFCGNGAEFVPYKDNGLTLKCKSMGCIQRNQRTLRYGIDWLRTSMAEHWNTRALSAQPSPGGQGNGPWPEIYMILADAYSAGAEGLQFEGIARCAAVRAAMAVNTARQPEYLYGSDELRARVEGERAAYLEGLEEGKSIAARQPDTAHAAYHTGKAIGRREAELEAAARQPVGYSGVRTCGDERPCINCYSDQGDCLGPAPSQDPTHQPVLQEPVAWISRIRCVGPEYGKEIYGKLPVQSLNPLYYEHIPLYAAPAQAVDLERFRPAVMTALGLSSPYGLERETLNELLDLIDSQAVGNG